MKINRFFETVLNAPPKNTRWSWGAIDSANKRVFLRVWDGANSFDKLNSKILVLNRGNLDPDDVKNHGFNERVAHLKLQAMGYTLYGVLCHHSGTQDRNAGLIQSFEKKSLLKLGPLHTVDGKVYADIDENILVADLAVPREIKIEQDLAELQSTKSIPETTQTLLIQARLGQGQFRKDLLVRYKRQCAVTGVTNIEILRASHIKPWCRSTNSERLDPNNGLLLTPSLDALFDRGFITFAKDGTVKVSNQLDERSRASLGPIESLAAKPNAGQIEYLKFHAAHVYRGDA